MQNSNRRTWIWLVVLLLLFISVSIYISSQQPKVYLNYVSDSPSPTGTKALFTYLKDENEASNIWSHPPERLPKTNKDETLLMIEPFFVPGSEEMKQYIDYMEQGNTVLLLMENPQDFFDIKTRYVEDVSSDEYTITGIDGRKFRAEYRSNVRLIPNKDDEILLQDEGGIVALKQTFGNGYLIVATAPWWLTNDQILKLDHLELALSLLNEAKTQSYIIDEYIHHGQDISSLFRIYPKWFMILMLQGALLTLLWLWSEGKRFGPIFTVREETVRFSDEGIKALTAWYLRGRRYHDSIVIQADYVKFSIQEKWGLSYNKEWIDLTDQLARKWTQLSASEVRSFLQELSIVLTKDKLSKQEYVLWSKKLDRLRKEVEES